MCFLCFVLNKMEDNQEIPLVTNDSIVTSDGLKVELPNGQKKAARSYPAPEGDRVNAHPKPEAVEQLVVLKHLDCSKLGVCVRRRASAAIFIRACGSRD